MGRVANPLALRIIGVFVIVLLAVILADWLNYFVLARGAPLRESVVLLGDFLQTSLLEVLLPALVISVFAMNRIRSVPLIALTAFLIMNFMYWVPALSLVWLSGSNVFWEILLFLPSSISHTDFVLILFLMLFFLALAGAFLIVKLIAGAEEKLAVRSVPTN